MSMKLIFVLLAAVLLVHNVHSAPAASSSSEENAGNIFKGIVERFKLLALTLDELLAIHKLIAEKGTEIVNKVIDDPKVNEIKTEGMKENLDKLRDFQKKLGKDPKKAEAKLFDFLDEFGDIVTKFDHEKNENLSDDDEVIEKSLHENGLTELRTAMREHFKVFVDKFTKEYDSYIAGLTEAEKKNEEELIAWFGKLKDEKDVEKQFNMFEDFLKEFESSSSSEE